MIAEELAAEAQYHINKARHVTAHQENIAVVVDDGEDEEEERFRTISHNSLDDTSSIYSQHAATATNTLHFRSPLTEVASLFSAPACWG